MKPLYIFDLDGTIALCDHRKHWLDRADLGGEPDCDDDEHSGSVTPALCVTLAA
jgi:hypothetical protein